MLSRDVVAVCAAEAGPAKFGADQDRSGYYCAARDFRTESAAKLAREKALAQLLRRLAEEEANV